MPVTVRKIVSKHGWSLKMQERWNVEVDSKLLAICFSEAGAERIMLALVAAWVAGKETLKRGDHAGA
jgi:hypothetical protein